MLVFRTSIDRCFAGPTLFLLVSGTGPPGYFEVGLKRYAQPTIRYDTRYGTYDTICSAIHLPFLAWEAEACDPGLRSEAPPSTYCNCLRRNDAQWLQQWRPSQSFQMQCLCDEFTHVIRIYWLLSAVSHVRFQLWYMLQLYRIVSKDWN